MNSIANSGDGFPRTLTFAEMNAVRGDCYNGLYNSDTKTGTIFQENGVIKSYVNGKLVAKVSP
jgi:hypothetical protein